MARLPGLRRQSRAGRWGPGHEARAPGRHRFADLGVRGLLRAIDLLAGGGIVACSWV